MLAGKEHQTELSDQCLSKFPLSSTARLRIAPAAGAAAASNL